VFVLLPKKSTSVIPIKKNESKTSIFLDPRRRLLPSAAIPAAA